MTARAAPLLVALGFAGCGSAPSAACPPGSATDGPRAAAVHEALARVPEGRDALARAGDHLVCFGDGASIVAAQARAIVLPRGTRPEAAAARAAHLLAHLREPALAAVPPRVDCAAWVRDALRAEARGIALELRVGAALGVGGAEMGYAFASTTPERDVFAALDANARVGRDATDLKASYAARCAAAARE